MRLPCKTCLDSLTILCWIIYDISIMDEIIKSPHDIFVKEVLSNRENARDFFFNYLPCRRKISR